MRNNNVINTGYCSAASSSSSFTTVNINHPPYVAQALRDTIVHARSRSDSVLSSNLTNNIKDVDNNLESYTASAIGQLVKHIDAGIHSPRNYRIEFEGNRTSSGVYIYKIIARSEDKKYIDTKKIIEQK